MAIDSNSLEELLKAIDIIATQRASENNAYDQTIICTIVDNSKAEEHGYYTVTNDTITFDAYSDNPDYKVGNYVRVSIPNGDYSQQKYIMGLYQYNDGEVVSYVAPLDTFMSIDTLVDNRAPQDGDGDTDLDLVVKPSIGLIANGKEKNIEIIDQQDFIMASDNWSAEEYKTTLQSQGIYDTIGLQADFKCVIAERDMRSGSYGLQLDLRILLNDNEGQIVTHTVYLDSSKFFGNPYNFKVYSKQAQLYDITNLGGTIVGFSVKPYQGDNFTYYNGEKIVSLEANENPNIFVANIYVALGSDLYKVDNHTVKLYTTDSLTYKHEYFDPVLDNTKILSVLWYNKDESHRGIGFSDGEMWDQDLNDFYDYDERQYIKETEENNRRLSQQGDTVANKCGALDASYYYNKALPLFDKAVAYIDSHILKELYRFKRALAGWSDAQRLVDDWTIAISRADDTEIDAKENILSQLDPQKDNSFRKVIEDYLSKGTGSNTTAYSKSLIDAFEAVINNPNSMILGGIFKNPDATDIVFAPGIKTQIIENDDYSKYRKVYEQYSKIILPILRDYAKQINHISDQILTINTGTWTGSIEQLIYKDQNLFIPKDFSDYDNQYDIYWYRYNPDYKDLEEQFMEPGWEPMTKGLRYAGMPIQKDPDNPAYLTKGCPPDRNKYEVFLKPDTHVEKFRVVIIQNHNYYYSNILEFTNEDDFGNKAGLTSDAIYVDHGENSLPSYHTLYAADYHLLNEDDAATLRELKLCCKEEFGGDTALAGADLYWYVPNSDSMIIVPETELLENLGFIELVKTAEDITREGQQAFDSDTEEGSNFRYYRPDHRCFFKHLPQAPEDEAPATEFDAWLASLDASLSFYYNISEVLILNHLRNVIDCVVSFEDDTDLEADIRLVFGATGTNGTNYNLVVMPATEQRCVTNSKPMPLFIGLYDYDGNLVPDVDFDLSFRDPKTKNLIPSNYIVKAMDKPNYYLVSHSSGSSGMGILTVGASAVTIVEENGTGANGEKRERLVDLFTQYPIPWGAQPTYHAAGATSIIYDSAGKNPQYYKNPYVLSNGVNKATNVTWSIAWYDADGNAVTSETDGYNFYKNYMPTITDRGTLIVSPMFVDNCECYAVVTGSIGGSVQWKQPIWITQNRYPSAYLNGWDGSLVIDEENNRILANLVGAGKKETDNSFSGVLMGEVSSIEIDTGTNPVYNRDHSGIGLYGFHHGAQSFGFNVDGTAFIGKSGGGRISFDGNQGFIYSDNWLQSFKGQETVVDPETNEEKVITTFKNAFIPIRDEADNIIYYELGEGKDGMAIDLRSGHIDANNFRLRSENVKFTSGRALNEIDKYIVNIETSPMWQDIKPNDEPYDNSKTYYIYDDKNRMYKVYEGDEAPVDDEGNPIQLYVLEYYMAACPDNAGFGDDAENLQYTYYTKNDDDTYTPYEGTAYPVVITLYEKIITYYYEKVPRTATLDFEKNTYWWIQDEKFVQYGGTSYPEDDGDNKVYLYTQHERSISYQKRSKEYIQNNEKSIGDYYIYDAEKKEYVLYKDTQYYKDNGDEYPDPVMLYKEVERGHGYYHIRFDKEGHLELSISDLTFLADKNITLGEYFDNVSNEIIRIEDEVIGVPPELEGVPIFDHITGQIANIEDSLIGSPSDINAGTIYSYINAQEYMTAEGIFNGLSQNGDKKGLFYTYQTEKQQKVDENGNLMEDAYGNPIMEDVLDANGDPIWLYDEYGNPIVDQLYINASYIATGILRSENWNGVLYYHPTDSDEIKGPWTIEEAEVAVANGDASWDNALGRWSLSAAAGTYWNLNNGQLFARHFELNALDAEMNGLYLNNEPSDLGYYLSIGHPGPRYEYDENGQIKTDAETGEPIIIAQRGDFIQYDSDGNLFMQMQNFVLNAWRTEYDANGNKIFEGGLVLDSNPTAENHTGYWFSAGEALYYPVEVDGITNMVQETANFIQFSKYKDELDRDRNKLVIQIGNGGEFELNAWNPDEMGTYQGIYMNSVGLPVTYEDTTEDKIYFRAGRGDALTVQTDSSEIIEVSKNRVLIASKNFVLDAYSHWMCLENADGSIIKLDPNSEDWKSLPAEKKAEYYEEGGIYMCSHPVQHSLNDKVYWDSYFKIGTDKRFVQYTGDHRLLMNVDHFALDAFDNVTKKGIYFNSNPGYKLNSEGYYVDENGNSLGIAPEQGVEPPTNAVAIAEDYYFVIGNGDPKNPSFIQMDANGRFIIQTNDEFTLNGWKENGGLYLTNVPEAIIDGDDTAYYFVLGQGAGSVLKYDNNGLLTVEGHISATSGDISGWQIAPVKRNTDGDIIMGKIYGTWEQDDKIYYLNLWSAFHDNVNTGGVGVKTVSGLTSGNWRIQAGYIVGTPDNPKTGVYGDYNMPEGFGVTREGEVAASRGIIAGWELNDNGLTSSGGEMKVLTSGIYCTTGAINENLLYVSTVRYNIKDRSTAASPTKPLQATVSNYNVSGWYNYGYQILTDDAFIVNTTTASNIEFYIVDALPLADGKLTYTFFDKSKKSITIAAGNKNNYLIINKYASADPISSSGSTSKSFELTPTKGLVAEGAQISGSITASSLYANTSGYIAGWKINTSGLILNRSDGGLCGLLSSDDYSETSLLDSSTESPIRMYIGGFNEETEVLTISSFTMNNSRKWTGKATASGTIRKVNAITMTPTITRTIVYEFTGDGSSTYSGTLLTNSKTTSLPTFYIFDDQYDTTGTNFCSSCTADNTDSLGIDFTIRTTKALTSGTKYYLRFAYNVGLDSETSLSYSYSGTTLTSTLTTRDDLIIDWGQLDGVDGTTVSSNIYKIGTVKVQIQYLSDVLNPTLANVRILDDGSIIAEAIKTQNFETDYASITRLQGDSVSVLNVTATTVATNGISCKSLTATGSLTTTGTASAHNVVSNWATFKKGVSIYDYMYLASQFVGYGESLSDITYVNTGIKCGTGSVGIVPVTIEYSASSAIFGYEALCLGDWRFQGTIRDSGGGSITSSSRLTKNSIENLDNRYLQLLDYVNPVRFKYNNGTSNRYHTGLILDELKIAMDKAGIDSTEMAAYCLEGIDNSGYGGIRYAEFIALIIAKLQQLSKQNQELQEQITNLQLLLNT